MSAGEILWALFGLFLLAGDFLWEHRLGVAVLIALVLLANISRQISWVTDALKDVAVGWTASTRRCTASKVESRTVRAMMRLGASRRPS